MPSRLTEAVFKARCSPSTGIRPIQRAASEHDAFRRKALRRHADLVLADATHCVANAADLEEVRARHARLVQSLASAAAPT